MPKVELRGAFLCMIAVVFVMGAYDVLARVI